MKNQSLVKQLWVHIAPRRQKQLILLLIVMLITSFFEVVSIGAILPFLGALVAPEKIFTYPLVQPLSLKLGLVAPSQLLLPVTIVFILAVLFAGGMRYILLRLQTRLGFAIGADLGYQIYKKTLYQPYKIHVGMNSSEVIASISSKNSSVIHQTLLPVLVIINSGVMFFAIIGALFLIEPIVAVIGIFGFGTLYAAILLATRRRLAEYSRDISRESNLVIKAIQEGLGGIRDVLIDRTQEVYCEVYRKSDLLMRNSQANVAIISVAPRYFIEAMGLVLIAILAYILATSSYGIVSYIPVLGALALGAQKLLPVMQQMFSSLTYMRGGEASLRDIIDLLDQSVPRDLEKQSEPISFQHSICAEHLAYRYDDSSQLILRDINLEIQKGSCVGFIGSTGSGKSTLLDILMGLLQPIEGSLLVDGVLITMNNCGSWQARIAHVPQSIFLTDATIAENIAFGARKEEIDYDRVMEAARNAKIAETIESWERKYNTLVGERGVRLSGGQRQRIGIARALYKKADVLILDEATSSLDCETESSVMQLINELDTNLTIIIVAHRIGTLQKCEKIYEISNGEIIDVVSYEALAGKTKEFSNMKKTIENIYAD